MEETDGDVSRSVIFELFIQESTHTDRVCERDTDTATYANDVGKKRKRKRKGEWRVRYGNEPCPMYVRQPPLQGTKNEGTRNERTKSERGRRGGWREM